MTPTTARRRPEPAGEPAPETIDPQPTPVEDVPAVATPPAEPAPAPEPTEGFGANGYPVEHSSNAGVPVFGRPDLGGHEPDTIAAFRRQQLAAYERGEVGVGALIAAPPGLDRTPADDLRDDLPLSAAEALAEVMRRVQPIAKARSADARVGGYAFRGIDDVYAALHDLFAEVGLVCLPSTLEREREQRPRMSGEGVNYVTHVRVRLRFLASDGTSEELDGWGEGADTGDKSTGKAYSQAMKSALLAAFLIPTESSSNDDPDASNSAPSRPWTAEEQQRAATALAAGREASTFDALVGVRRRAEHLLDVPLAGPDGSIAPLRLHLDALRAQLERGVQS
jgi:hypothetical protein